MTSLLIVLNPRRIPACIDAISSLDIPKVWLRYMSEPMAATQVNEIAAATSFDRYVILSDDTIPTQATLDLVLDAAEHHPVATGYCNLDEGQYASVVNVMRRELPPGPPKVDSYRFLTRSSVEKHTGVFETTFAGLSLTAIDRDVLLDHPLRVAPGTQCCMDYDLSYRLAQSGVRIVAPVGAFVRHVKETWNTRDRSPEKQLLVGSLPAEVAWDPEPVCV